MKYIVIGGKKTKTITAKSISEAGRKASRLFPRAKLIGVTQAPTKSGREETYWITR